MEPPPVVLPRALTVRLERSSRVLVVMRGLPGSGKSTAAAAIQRQAEAAGRKGSIHSADTFFTRDGGDYVFRAEQLPEAHKHCLTGLAAALVEGQAIAIVDNVHARKQHYARAEELAREHGYDVVIAEISPDINNDTLSRRNLHGVPIATISRMRKSWEADFRAVVVESWRGEGTGARPMPPNGQVSPRAAESRASTTVASRTHRRQGQDAPLRGRRAQSFRCARVMGMDLAMSKRLLAKHNLMTGTPNRDAEDDADADAMCVLGPAASTVLLAARLEPVRGIVPRTKDTPKTSRRQQELEKALGLQAPEGAPNWRKWLLGAGTSRKRSRQDDVEAQDEEVESGVIVRSQRKRSRLEGPNHSDRGGSILAAGARALSLAPLRWVSQAQDTIKQWWPFRWISLAGGVQSQEASSQLVLSGCNECTVSRLVVFLDLWRRGFVVSSGAKFGADFTVYDGDPAEFHAFASVKVLDNGQAPENLPLRDVFRFGRGSHTVSKESIYAWFTRPLPEMAAEAEVVDTGAPTGGENESAGHWCTTQAEEAILTASKAMPLLRYTIMRAGKPEEAYSYAHLKTTFDPFLWPLAGSTVVPQEGQ